MAGLVVIFGPGSRFRIFGSPRIYLLYLNFYFTRDSGTNPVVKVKVSTQQSFDYFGGIFLSHSCKISYRQVQQIDDQIMFNSAPFL